MLHVAVEDFLARFAQRLRAVHGEIGVPQDLLGMFVFARTGRYADAGRRYNLVVAEANRAHKRLLDTICNGGRLFHVLHTVQENDELITPEARDGIVGSDNLAQPPCDGHQQLVAQRVTQAVVDHLEAIEVQEEHREDVITAPVHAGQSVAQPVDEERPVGQSGQRVVKGVVAESLLNLLAIRNVRQRSSYTVDHVVLVFESTAATQQPPVLSVFVA